MKYIGAHVSSAGGVSKAPGYANEIGAKAFALFTRNPSRWQSKPISEKDAQAFKDNCLKFGYTPAQILPHDSYLINLGSQRLRHPSIDAAAYCFQSFIHGFPLSIFAACLLISSPRSPAKDL